MSLNMELFLFLYIFTSLQLFDQKRYKPAFGYVWKNQIPQKSPANAGDVCRRGQTVFFPAISFMRNWLTTGNDGSGFLQYVYIRCDYQRKSCYTWDCHCRISRKLSADMPDSICGKPLQIYDEKYCLCTAEKETDQWPLVKRLLRIWQDGHWQDKDAFGWRHWTFIRFCWRTIN